MGSFKQDDYDISCATPENYIFKAWLLDDDDNESEHFTLPYEYP